MARLYKTFLDFNKSIRLSEEDRKKLLSHRESLRKRMRENYKKTPNDVKQALDMRFQSQGSYVMDTIIKPIGDDYDLDDGVYFIERLPQESRPNPQDFHDWVENSVDNDVSYEKVTPKDTCVRVEFKNKSHIDLPIYYFEGEHPELAHKKNGWMTSDPIEFIQWFEDKVNSGFERKFLTEYSTESENYKTWLNDIRKKDAQIRRIVRYLKAWSNFVGGPMPCGLILTVLVAQNYIPSHGDDLALKNTLNKIHQYLRGNGIKCFRPTTPIDEELFAGTSHEDKQYFFNKLRDFVFDAEAAISASTVRHSAQIWSNHLGERFVLSANDLDTPISSSPSQHNLRQVITQKPWYPNSK